VSQNPPMNIEFSQMLRQPEATILKKWLEGPLYQKDEGPIKSIRDTVRSLQTLQGKYETYCPGCRKDSLFRPVGNEAAIDQARQEMKQRQLAAAAVPLQRGGANTSTSQQHYTWLGEFSVKLMCERNARHVVRIYMEALQDQRPRDVPPDEWILASTGHLQKCGQSPSIADSRLGQIDKFEGAFSIDQTSEWKRSVITQAHGFSVAACVHLRRMFEGLLWEARDMVSEGQYKGTVWPEFDGGSRISEKVKLVASELPPFIVEHPELYGVLSKGIHELTEAECADELPVLQECMSLIAQQRVEQRLREKREKETKKLLSEAASRLGKA
jgi:hypothetical protein